MIFCPFYNKKNIYFFNINSSSEFCERSDPSGPEVNNEQLLLVQLTRFAPVEHGAFWSFLLYFLNYNLFIYFFNPSCSHRLFFLCVLLLLTRLLQLGVSTNDALLWGKAAGVNHSEPLCVQFISLHALEQIFKNTKCYLCNLQSCFFPSLFVFKLKQFCEMRQEVHLQRHVHGTDVSPPGWLWKRIQ